MFDRIETLRMAGALTQHASQRQKLIAQNVANADTPGFRAHDLKDFAGSYRRSGQIGMRHSNPAHLAASSWEQANVTTDDGHEPSPNGNTVSLEEEMIRSAHAKRQFDLSLAVTRSAMTLIRTSIGRRQ